MKVLKKKSPQQLDRSLDARISVSCLQRIPWATA